MGGRDVTWWREGGRYAKGDVCLFRSVLVSR
jgi:hypothetical protein